MSAHAISNVPYQIADHSNIDRYDQSFWPCDPEKQLIDFDRQVKPAGNHREILRPSSRLPEAVRLNQAQHRIQERHGRQQPEPLTGQCCRRLKEDAGIATGWIDMKVPHDFFRDALDVLMNQGEQTEAGDQHQSAFGSFKQCYDSQPAMM